MKNTDTERQPDRTELAISNIITRQDVANMFAAPMGMQQALDIVRNELDQFSKVADVTTKKGQAEIKSMAAKVARSKTLIDDCGKKIVADLKDMPKKIDAERKRVRDTLDAWRDEVRAPVTKMEEDEEARIKKHQDYIAHLKIIGSSRGDDAVAALEEVKKVKLSRELMEEFYDEAIAALDDVIAKLQATISLEEEMAKARAIIAAEEQRKRDEATERRVREELDAKHAAEMRKIIADKAAPTSETRKDGFVNAVGVAGAGVIFSKDGVQVGDRLDGVDGKVHYVAEGWRAPMSELGLGKDIKMEHDKEHIRSVNRAALEVVKKYCISDVAAKDLIIAISRDEVPHITINY